MDKKVALFCLAIVFVSQAAFGARLYTWGKAESISLNDNCIHSFDGFNFCFDEQGYVSIFKEGVLQASMQFGMSGEQGIEKVFFLSSDFGWQWHTNSSTGDLIEVVGVNDSKDFLWTVTLKAERYGYMKFSNIVENISKADLVNASYFYLFNINKSENPVAVFGDKAFDYKENDFNSDKTEIAKIEQKQVSTNKFTFSFQDAIDSGFELENAFFGKLDALPTASLFPTSSLPTTSGYTIALSKGDLLAGKKIEIDPTITVPYVNSGWVRYKDGALGSFSQTSLFVGHYGDETSYYWYRGLIEFDTTRLTKVSSATLNLNYKGKLVNGETCSFDINSVETFGDIGLADWDTTKFEVIEAGAFDQTISLDFNTNITTTWNNNKDNAREYVAIRIGLVNQESYTDTSNDCRIEFCDNPVSSCTFAPYIEFQQYLDINVNSPSVGNYIGPSTATDGNYPIDFNVAYNDSNYLFADIYLSSSGKMFEYLVIKDLNLHYFGNILNRTSDINCDSNNFSASYEGGFPVNCFYDFNFYTIPDGNYVVDINLHTFDDFNSVESSGSFSIDTNTPSTSWDGNHATWQNMDANITLTCNDVGACASISYQFDDDPSIFKNWSATVTVATGTTTDVNLPKPGSFDGNYSVKFRSTDVAGNTPSDWNDFYVLIDKSAPFASSFVPDTNGTTDDTTPDLNITFSDANTSSNSGVASCGYLVHIGNTDYAYGTATAINGQCKYTYDTDLTEGQVIHLDWNATDGAGNTSSYIKGFSYTYSPPALGPSGAGGTVVVTVTPVVTIPSLVNLFTSTNTIYLSPTAKKEYRVIIESLSDSDMVVDVFPSPELEPFVILGDHETILLAKTTVVWKWLVSIPEDMNLTETIAGVFTVDLAEGQEQVELELFLQPAPPSLFDIEIAGLPITIVAFIGVGLFATYEMVAPPKRKIRIFKRVGIRR